MIYEKYEKISDCVPFEAALDLTGFGLYNYIHTLITGVIIIALVCVSYSSSILVPASACELGTTVAQQGVLAATPLIGGIIGAFLWGYLGDTRGRHRMLLVCSVLAIIFNSLASLSVNWIMLVVLQFIGSLAAAGKYTLGMALLSESVPLARRNLVVLLVSSMFLLAQGIMAVLAIPVIPLRFSYYLPVLGIYWNSWRTVMLIYSVPSILGLIGLMFLHESPKLLLVKGHEEKALDVLRTIHRINHRGCNKEFQVKKLLPEEAQVINEKISVKEQFVPLFKTPLLMNTITVVSLFLLQQVAPFSIWLPSIANLVSQTLQTGEGSNLTVCRMIDVAQNTPPNPDAVPCALNESALLMVLGVGALQSLVNLLVSLVVDRTGRRNMAICIVTVVGLSGMLVNVVPNAIGSFMFFAIFLLGVITHGLYTAIVVALFPTRLRAMAISLCLACDRISSFATIQILNLLLVNNCEAGFYTFAVIVLLLRAVVDHSKWLQQNLNPLDLCLGMDSLFSAFERVPLLWRFLENDSFWNR